MVYLIIDGCAYALGIAFIIEGCRDAAHLCRGVIDDPVYLLRAHAGAYLIADLVENRDVDLRALADLLDLRRCLYQAVIRHNMALQLAEHDLFVKSHMTVLIFSAAAAPAGIISADF